MYETQYKYQMECNNLKRRHNRKCKQCEFEFLYITGHIILLNPFVPLIVSFLFLRTKNRRRILRLFSPVVLTPSDNAMAMSYISDHGTDVERKRSGIWGAEQNSSSSSSEEILQNSLISVKCHIQGQGTRPQEISLPNTRFD